MIVVCFAIAILHTTLQLWTTIYNVDSTFSNFVFFYYCFSNFVL